MLDSSFLKILLFTLVLSSCGGGNNSATPPSEGSFVSQQKSINGLVVDGYIRNADIWIETTNDFSNIGEIKGPAGRIAKGLGSLDAEVLARVRRVNHHVEERED